MTIYQGVRALRDGLKAVDEVVGKLEGRVDEARDAFAALVADLGSIKDDVTEAAQGAQELFDSLCVAVPPATDPTLDPASCDQIQAVIDCRRVRARHGRWGASGHQGPRRGDRRTRGAGEGAVRDP